MTTQISVGQLKRAIEIKEEIESLSAQLAQILGTGTPTRSADGRRQMSAAGREAIRQAQLARWAKARAGKSAVKAKRRMSAAARAKMAAAAKARWKAAKAAGKLHL